MAKREQTKQEKALRRYFKGRKVRGALVLTGLGAIVAAGAIFGVNEAGLEEDVALIAIAVGLGMLGLGLLFILRAALRRLPSDKRVSQWFEQGIERLTKESLAKLSLAESELVADALVIRGPILWSTPGVADQDLVWRLGKDDELRFGVYRVTIIQLTDRLMGAYSCDYSFIRDVALNEETEEYHYQDVVGVSTQELASSYTLPTGVKLTHAQQFRISVTSGEAIEVVIGAEKLRKVTRKEKMPETGAERAVSVIRAMLRDKKR